MSVIFLDIDGVLNHQRLYDDNLARGTPTPPEGWIDRACVARLNALCARTGARLVISSSWRTYETIPGQPVGGLVGTVAVLRACGLTTEVIGATPDHATEAQRARHERADRWPEIRAWLAAHPEVGAWVVLDDSGLPGVPATAFVRTELTVGLTDADVERAAQVLRGPPVALSEVVTPPPASPDPRAFLTHPGFRSWARALRYERRFGQRDRMLRAARR